MSYDKAVSFRYGWNNITIMSVYGSNSINKSINFLIASTANDL